MRECTHTHQMVHESQLCKIVLFNIISVMVNLLHPPPKTRFPRDWVGWLLVLFEIKEKFAFLTECEFYREMLVL